jgi:hypothetical protein
MKPRFLLLVIDEAGNINPRMPEAMLVAAQAYLLTTRPTPSDPCADMHNAALQGLKLVGSKLQCREDAPAK